MCSAASIETAKASTAASYETVMTRNPVSCHLDDDVHEVMGLMSRHQVGQLPVLHEGGDRRSRSVG